MLQESGLRKHETQDIVAAQAVEVGPVESEAHSPCADLPATLAEIMIAARRYRWLMQAEKRLENQVGAFFINRGKALKEFAGQKVPETQDVDAGDNGEVSGLSERETLARSAATSPKKKGEKKKDSIDKAMKRENKETTAKVRKIMKNTGGQAPTYSEIQSIVGPADEAVVFYLDAMRMSMEKAKNEQGKVLEKLAEKLPIWKWAEPIPGIGSKNIALIVGQAGRDLWHYGNPAKLWKRFGVGLISSGERQQKFKDKDKAIEAGYNPSRRACLHVVGTCFVMGNFVKPADGKGEKKDGEYRQVFLARKEYEAERDPEMMQTIVDKRGQRHMEKRFLRNMWIAWRELSPMPEGATPSLKPLVPMSPTGNGNGNGQ